MADYGIIGQIQGPFSSNTNVVQLINAKIGKPFGEPIFAKLGISLAEKDYMIFGAEEDGTMPTSFKFYLDQGEGATEFWVGRTQIYESDEGITIKSLVFPQGAPASVLIEYVILDSR